MLRMIVKKLKAYQELREAQTALRQADDRMLSDIGVSRAQIDQVVRYGRS